VKDTQDKCQYHNNCPIYNRFKTELLKNIYISKYCLKDYKSCMRYQYRLKGQQAPDYLLPDGKTLHHAKN